MRRSASVMASASPQPDARPGRERGLGGLRAMETARCQTRRWCSRCPCDGLLQIGLEHLQLEPDAAGFAAQQKLGIGKGQPVGVGLERHALVGMACSSAQASARRRVHPDIHRVGKVGVSAVLLVQNDLVDLVVGLEHDFGAEVGDQALELHAHGGRVAAAAAVFGFQDDHRVFAVHDHIAGADFLSDFHSGSRGLGRCPGRKIYTADAAVAAGVGPSPPKFCKALDFNVFFQQSPATGWPGRPA
jgi:hypothetical protein